MMKILSHIKYISSNKNSFFNFINDPMLHKYYLKKGVAVYEKLNLI